MGMFEPETLRNQGIIEALCLAKQGSTVLNMSFLSAGKWKTAKTYISDIDDSEVMIKSDEPGRVCCSEILKTDQPVGISFEIEHFKYIFESKVVRCSHENGCIVLEIPEKIEKLMRRSYSRVLVPENLAVKVMFWHRGYDDEKGTVPNEDFWQGRLLNLSAGGMKMSISADKKCHFEPGQLVGLQFTAMPYEKPVLLEGLVIHIHPAEDGNGDFFELGVEFLGLEISWEGRNKLRRLVEIIEQYEKINSKNGHTSNGKKPVQT
jgi:c-di-GMP-binding flagellar brake protein YcgR